MLLLWTMVASAQCVVKGRVLDKQSSEPLGFVAVKVLRPQHHSDGEGYVALPVEEARYRDQQPYHNVPRAGELQPVALPLVAPFLG